MIVSKVRLLMKITHLETWDGSVGEDGVLAAGESPAGMGASSIIGQRGRGLNGERRCFPCRKPQSARVGDHGAIVCA